MQCKVPGQNSSLSNIFIITDLVIPEDPPTRDASMYGDHVQETSHHTAQDPAVWTGRGEGQALSGRAQHHQALWSGR